jgi:uncharacterized protein YeaO (DUF488 family)
MNMVFEFSYLGVWADFEGVNVAEKRQYYDDWWNGRKSGNLDLELAPSKELKDAFIKYMTITWSEDVRRFIDEIKNNPKAQKALETLSNYDGTVTLLCHSEVENLCYRSIVKQMIGDIKKM